MSHWPVSNEHVWILLPHHDDEFFLGLHLNRLARLVERVSFIYLTFDDNRAGIRAGETKKYLERVGVRNASIIEVGIDLNILDGALHRNIQKCLECLKLNMENDRRLSIFVPAWEGGHHDHDAANIIGSLLRRDFPNQVKLFEFGLYSGQNLSGPFFCVTSFSRRGKTVAPAEPGGYLERIGHSFLAMTFKSQWRTFCGLLPFVFLSRILDRRVNIGHVPMDRDYSTPPHSGLLFYQRRFKVDWTEFLSQLKHLK
jgi:hypothetical protein